MASPYTERSFSTSSYVHALLIDLQKPHTGRTLSHFVFLARQTRQAFRLLLRGYRDDDVRGRFLDSAFSRSDSGPLESDMMMRNRQSRMRVTSFRACTLNRR
jgi:hypothetical protein